MSDTPKKPMDENDAIRKMLDRLRKTVIEPQEEENVAPLAQDEPRDFEEAEENEAAPVVEVASFPEIPEETAPAVEEEPQETPPAPVYVNAFDGDDLFAEEDAEEEEALDAEEGQDTLDAGVISEFFTLEEEEEEMPTPFTEEEPAPESVDMTYLVKETVAAPQAPARAVPSDVEEAPVPPAPKKDSSRDPISFFSPSVPARRPAAADTPALDTDITDREAEDLFASKRPASFGSNRARYLAGEEGSEPLPAFDTPLFATEENGYAVEVAVAPKSTPEEATPAPAAEEPAAKTPEKTEKPIETVDDRDYTDEQDDAFYSLIDKLEPQAEIAPQRKPQPKKEATASPFGRAASGEQLSMDLFETAPSKAPEEKREAPAPTVEIPAEEKIPATPASSAPTATEEAAVPVFFGEMPASAPSSEQAASAPALEPMPERPAHRPIPFDESPVETAKKREAAEQTLDASSDEEPMEVELPPDQTLARPIPTPAAAPRRRRVWRKGDFLAAVKAFFARLAPTAGEGDVLNGLYTEEAAAYNEYSSRNQSAIFARKFVSESSLCTLRIILLAFLCTFLLALENFSLVGYLPAGTLASVDVQIALHLLSMLVVSIASIPLFSRAWRRLFARSVSAETFPAILLLLAIVYDVLLYFLAPIEFTFFGLIPATFALLVAIADQRKTKGDFASFRLLSSSGDKLACTVTAGGRTAGETAAVSDLPEGGESRIVSMKKVGFTTGFFHRIVRNCEDGYHNLVLLATASVISLGIAIAAGVIADSFLAAFYAFLLSLSLLLPAILPLFHKLPAAMLSLRAASQNCAVVGEVSALEYSDAAAMTFEDVEAFPAKKMRIQRIKLYNDSALDRVLYQVASLFSTVGGPLDGVFRASTAELGVSENALLLQAESDGLYAMVDGHRIRVGSGEYMLDHAVHVFYDPEDEKLLAGGKMSVMFAAEDGRLVAKFYIRYKMDERFEKSVEALHRRGIRTLIRTFDPNLSRELIDKISYTADFAPAIVKKTIDQRDDLAAPELNSGLVTKTASADLLRTLFACRRTVRLIRASTIAAYALLGVGLVGSILLTVFLLLSAIPSVIFFGYQVALALLFFLISKIFV